jgi:pseudaminic acid synthase
MSKASVTPGGAPTITIAGRMIGDNQPPYVIAEISANHNGSIGRAIEIMEAAAAAGADAIKIQTYTADTLTIDHDGPDFRVEGGLWDGRTLYSLYEEAHTPWAWHADLFAKGRELGVPVFSSPFDFTAVDFLEALDVPAYKIASFELVDLPLIRKCAATGKPLIMSTGMASLEEVDEAVGAAQKAGAAEIALLHCTSGYPTPPSESDLRTIPHLARRFGLVTGLSDHTPGISAPVTAVALGASIVEKHFTLSREDGGLDAAFSLEPRELASLTESVRFGWEARGRVRYDRTASEQGTARFRRSLYIVEDMAAGDVLTSETLRSIRPGFGLAPKHYDELLGQKVVRAVARGTPASWDLVT